MTKGLGAWLFGYGFVLFAIGASAFLSNPAFPLFMVAGAIAGGLMAAFGVLATKGAPWARTAAMMLTLALLMPGLAVGMHFWLQVFKSSGGLSLAVLSTLLVLASGTVLWRLKKKA